MGEAKRRGTPKQRMEEAIEKQKRLHPKEVMQAAAKSDPEFALVLDAILASALGQRATALSAVKPFVPKRRKKR